MTDPLRDHIRQSLARPVMDEAQRLADTIVADHTGSVTAILFYGSCLRDETPEGVLDFYVLVDDYAQWHGSGVAALVNRILPPNVIFLQDGDVAAKVAIISTQAFGHRMRPGSFDTTLWARFCQPAALLYARDEHAMETVVEAVATASTTAWDWARAFAPSARESSERWTALFRQTYRAELRVERGGDRAAAIYAKASDHFDTLASLAHPITSRRPGGAQRAWIWRIILGKPLNAVRVLKGAFTFAGAVDYMTWKVERHSGKKLDLSPFQRRHPLIASPFILWRLLRDGLVR